MECLTMEPRRPNATKTHFGVDFYARAFWDGLQKNWDWMGKDVSFQQSHIDLGVCFFCFLSCHFLSVTSSPVSFLFSFLITTGYGLSSLAGWLAAREFLAGFPCTISVRYWCTRQGLLDEDRGRGERWK
ncbi:hypothetical protein LB507_000101 [Fusarium sp. FIESC RH6]|nr:hypothetical protein LB507_000101 [Fusarium sp. FIESC RH6]